MRVSGDRIKNVIDLITDFGACLFNLICWSELIIRAMSSIPQLHHPINDDVLFLDSDWSFLVIDTSNCCNDQ